MIYRLLFIFLLTLIFTASPWETAQAQSKSTQKLKIAVIDTGCDFEHPLLQTYIRLPSLFDGLDQSGHGTHIAGIIVSGLRKKHLDQYLEIVPIRFFDEKNNDKQLTNSFATAIKRAIDQNVQIIHISAGGPQASLKELELFELAQKKGILVIAAAGNKSTTEPSYQFYPAAYPLDNIISIVGTNSQGQRLETSNINNGKRNFYFPGENIYSSLPGNRFGHLTGSSQAAAKATAKIASLWLTKGQETALAYVSPKSFAGTSRQ